MGLLTSAAKAALKPASVRLVDVLELDLPGGTWRLGPTAGDVAASASLGLYEPRLDPDSWSEIAASIGDRSGAMELQKASVVMADLDRRFETLVEGPDGLDVERSVARVRTILPGLAPADWPLQFTGVLESWNRPAGRPGHWQLAMRTDDRPLRRQGPGRKIGHVDFPDAPAASIGKVVPIIAGKHDSRRLSGTGAVPAIPVSQQGTQHLLAAHACWAVPRVYADGVLLATSAYAVTAPVINGRRYTRIDFVSAMGNASIACDVYGLEMNGDGTGDLVVNPIEQLRRMLTAWWFADYQSGAYPSESGAPIESASWDTVRDFLGTEDARGSRYVDAVATGFDLLQQCLETSWLYAWVTPGGKIALGYDDHRRTTVYFDDPWLRDWETTRDFGSHYDGANVIDRVKADFGREAASGNLLASLEVRDPAVQKDAPLPVQLVWSEARARVDPRSVLGLTLWVSGRQPEVRFNNNLPTWFDGSGNGRHISQATATNRPTGRAMETGLNGLMSVQFDGVDNWMGTAVAPSAVMAASAATVISVVLPQAITEDNATLEDNHTLWAQASATPDVGVVFRANAGAPALHAFNRDAGGLDSLSHPVVVGAPYVHVWMHSGGVLYSGLNAKRRGDMLSVASGDTVDLTGALRLGSSDLTANRWYAGLLGELMVFNVAVADADLHDLVEDLISQWGLY